MPIDDLGKSTVAELEALGYTHVQLQCNNCGHQSVISFVLLRSRGTIARETPFVQVAAQVRCAKCRRNPAPEALRPVKHWETAAAKSRKIRRDSL